VVSIDTPHRVCVAPSTLLRHKSQYFTFVCSSISCPQIANWIYCFASASASVETRRRSWGCLPNYDTLSSSAIDLRANNDRPPAHPQIDNRVAKWLMRYKAYSESLLDIFSFLFAHFSCGRNNLSSYKPSAAKIATFLG